MFSYVLERLKEKSTWVSFGSALTGIGVTISPDKWQLIMGVGMGLSGIVSMLIPSRVTENNIKPDPAK